MRRRHTYQQFAGNAIAPNLTGQAIKLANDFLPAPSGPDGDRLQSGWQSRGEKWRGFTRHLDAASVRNNEQQRPL